MELLIRKFRELFLYGIIGASCATLDFLIYTLLLYISSGHHILLANSISVTCGIVTSFLLNRQYNFKVKDKLIKRFVSFLTVGIIGLMISSALIIWLVDEMNINMLIAKLMTIIVVSLVQFILNKFITFKTT